MTFLLLLTACSGETGGVSRSDITGIQVVPETVTLTTRKGEPSTATFEAFAVDVTGAYIPLDLVAWETTNLATGSIDEKGRFLSVDTNGGVTHVNAAYLGLEGTAEVTVEYREEVLADGLDASVIEAFQDATSADNPSLTPLYPSDGVRVPRNLNGLKFFWDRASDDHVVRLRLQTQITDISIYTQTDDWTSTSDLLKTVAATNRGGEIEVTLESGLWDGTTLTDVEAGPPVALDVNRLDATGSVFLWAAISEVIQRLTIGALETEDFWPADEDYGDAGPPCVGCHVFNAASETMIVTHNGINGVFSVIDVSDIDDPVTLYTSESPQHLTFKDASPDGKWIVGSSMGDLVIWELESGDHHRTSALQGDYSQPAFSPDGESLIAVRATQGFRHSMSFEGGEIVEFEWNDGGLGDSQVIVPASSKFNYYYPVYSPDGEWLALNRSTGDSYGDLDAELMLVRRDGTLLQVLDRANVGSELQNSYPRWAPLSDDDVMWLAFSSKRTYPGNPLPLPFPQLWVTAINPSVALDGGDPSSPAFYLPGQDMQSDNHLAVWWHL